MTSNTPRNWIADNSRASKPPDYFLQRIYDYDAMLVVLPSRDHPGAYVLGRRKQFSAGLTEKAVGSVYTKADTRMCILNGCVPVCMMMQNGTSWDPEQIIAKLDARDIWKLGGADKAADLLEEQEERAKQKVRDDIRDDLWNRSGDAWRSYQARTGQSTIKFKDNYPTPTSGTVTDSPSTGEVAAPSIPLALEVQQDSAPTGGLSAGAEPIGQ